MDPLPIDAHLPAIISTLRTAGALVLSAPPGAGKTTRVPRALCDHGFAQKGEILILEPRRLAARLAAARVAQELGEKPGETVGYSIRFENVSSPATRIRFLTEAILARRIVQDPDLKGVSVVILDEFHERHLATDLALGFLKGLQAKRPELKIIVMSATLDAEPVAAFLNGAQLMSVPGSPFEVEIEFEEKASDRPVHDKVAAAVSRLLRSGPKGDILVFLPGSSEIRRAAEALQPQAERSSLLVLPLHGDLPASEQRRAIEQAERTKVILATNVAETSITVPAVVSVVDSGLARVAGYSPWSGFPTLSIQKISKSSAIQRAGRAGRTQAGRVLRLYTRPDFESRPPHETPEIRRADLSETSLMLHGAGMRDINAFHWFEAPPKSSIEAAETLLLKLGAVKEDGRITETGIQMLHIPVHPRLARLILEGKNLNVADDCTLLAALLSERDIRLRTRASFGPKTSRAQPGASGLSDLLELLECFREAESARFTPERLLALGLDPAAIQAVRRAQRQLRRLSGGKARSLPAAGEESLLISVLTAFPDRVAKRRNPGSRELLLAGGGSATLSPASVVHNPEFMVAVDAEERRESILRDSGTVIRLASAIEIEWLAGLSTESIFQKTELVWNERARRVDQFSCTSYGQITLEEKTNPAPRSGETARILSSVAIARQLSDFKDVDSLPAFRARVTLVARHFPGEQFPSVEDRVLNKAVERLCAGKRSLEELAQESLIHELAATLTDRQRHLLDREAPERIKLKTGRSVKVHYESDRPPWIESRLQDFFGMSATPTICAGLVPLTVHLLAPNGRAVQVTSDLAGFWERHYPSIRRELKRRYPKHAWPEPFAIDN